MATEAPPSDDATKAEAEAEAEAETEAEADARPSSRLGSLPPIHSATPAADEVPASPLAVATAPRAVELTLRPPPTQAMDLPVDPHDGQTSPIRSLMEKKLSESGSEPLSRSDSGNGPTPRRVLEFQETAFPVPRSAASFFGGSAGGGDAVRRSAPPVYSVSAAL